VVCNSKQALSPRLIFDFIANGGGEGQEFLTLFFEKCTNTAGGPYAVLRDRHRRAAAVAALAFFLYCR